MSDDRPISVSGSHGPRFVSLIEASWSLRPLLDNNLALDSICFCLKLASCEQIELFGDRLRMFAMWRKEVNRLERVTLFQVSLPIVLILDQEPSLLGSLTIFIILHVHRLLSRVPPTLHLLYHLDPRWRNELRLEVPLFILNSSIIVLILSFLNQLLRLMNIRQLRNRWHLVISSDRRSPPLRQDLRGILATLLLCLV